MNIPGYQVKKKIYESAKTSIYRAVQKKSQQTVILKLSKLTSSSGHTTKLEHEYDILKKLNTDGVIKALKLESYKSNMVLVLEDFRGEPLNKIIKTKKIDLELFLNIAIQLSDSLQELHANDIIHKDVNPRNIIINWQSRKVKLIDFGISEISVGQGHTVNIPNLSDGTLAYMSPEQTGRMNRAIDYRTDLYSLGVTLYELLTGRVPFEAKDPIELVHCHIAKKPKPPLKVDSKISKVLSDIIVKLLSKNAEDRYKTPYGLSRDLKNCLDNYNSKSDKIGDFVLGDHDITDRLQISQKLYGRQREMANILSAFNRISNFYSSAEMVLISGYSGVGKSALVYEMHKPIVEKKGFFISGKFDQLKRNIPYFAFFQAFQELIRQLLTENEESVSKWKARLLKAFGANGQVLINVIPELKLIVGEQPPLKEIGPVESQNRFNLVFQNFIKVFAKQEHPLVIFLDDLQWVDMASLHLIKLFLTEMEENNLLLIGAYRDNKVSPSHPLMLTMEEIKGIIPNRISNIFLKSLSLENVNELVKDSFLIVNGQARSLARLLKSKTSGNPFFLNQFLKSLYEKSLISFNREKALWQWSLGKIKKTGITENVVDLMIQKIKTLTKRTQELLKLAACVGNRFDLDTLAIVNRRPVKEIESNLNPAYKNGLIYLIKGEYRFLHDRVQQAAYKLVKELNKKEIQLRIGRLLLKNISKDELNEKIFDITDRFNISQALLKSPKEIYQVAKLNLKAGNKAKSSAAYDTALKYSSAGVKLLGKDLWRKKYQLTYDLYRLQAECEYLCGNFKASEKLFNILLDKAKTKKEKAEIFSFMVQFFTSSGNLKKAIKSGLNGLRQLGLSMPENPDEVKAEITKKFQNIEANLKDKKIETIARLPIFTDRAKIQVMEICQNMHPPAFMSGNLNLYTLMTLLMVDISLVYGNSPISSYAYIMYGVMLATGFNDYNNAYKFGKMGLKLSEKFRYLPVEAKNHHSFANFINHWKKHAQTDLDYFLTAYKKGADSGDFPFAGYAIIIYISTLLFTGKSLESVSKEVKKYYPFIEKTKSRVLMNLFMPYMQFNLNLRGIIKKNSSLTDANYNEESGLKDIRASKNLTTLCLFQICKLKLLYLFGNYRAAKAIVTELEQNKVALVGTAPIIELVFYCFLNTAALFSKYTKKEKESALKNLTSHLEQMRSWEESCPENFENLALLMSAEMAKIEGNDLEAMSLYDQAIQSAGEQNFINHQAIAYECAANFYLSRNKQYIAKYYMNESYLSYLTWGATAKAEYLNGKYLELLTEIYKITPVDYTHATSSLPETMEEWDMISVLKISQNISGEIDRQELIKKLIKIVIENAGAQKVFLMLDRSGDLMIEAFGNMDKGIRILKSISALSSRKLPQAIINYVKRTGDHVVIDDAIKEKRFQTDLYIKNFKPKSILCMPIIRQTQLIGILYLENNLATNAFTPKRVNILKVLSTQAAISLENAVYFNELKKVNKDLTLEISERRKAEEALRRSEERYALAVRGANDGLWDWDLTTGEIYFSPRWKLMVGFKDNEIKNSSDEWFNRVHPDDIDNLDKEISSHLEGALPHFEKEYRMLHKDGSYRWIQSRGIAIKDSEGRLYRMAGSQTDISKRKFFEDQLRHDALHDSLTGLPNWNLLMDRLDFVIKRIKRHKDQHFAVLYLDVDRFNVINDSLGHKTGNKLLLELAKRLQVSIRPEDTIARLSGDQFAILLDDIKDLNDVIKVIGRIKAELIPHFDLNGKEYFLTLSTGIALSHNEYSEPGEIIRDADTAMHRAKKLGRDRYEIFDKKMHKNAITFLQIESDLRRAIKSKEFQLYYQPIFSLKSGEIICFEALIRWQHYKKGLLLPGEFISVAEESGLIGSLGEWVLYTACAQNKSWQDKNGIFLPMTVNLSAQQFQKSNLIEVVDHTLDKAKLGTEFLQLELTESILIHNLDEVARILGDLKKRGIQIIIDDFGTGYSSLSYLSQFPIDTLKIDHSFIRNITSSKNDAALGKAIIAMGHSLQMKVIAEGVEEKEQVSFLQNHNCDAVQGFYFSYPLVAADFIKLAAKKQ